MKTFIMVVSLIALSSLSFNSYADNICSHYHIETDDDNNIVVPYQLYNYYRTNEACDDIAHFTSVSEHSFGSELNVTITKGKTNGKYNCEVTTKTISFGPTRIMR